MDTKEIIITELNNETIESMIYIIRGQKVMLDFELAKIYGYETKRFNEQVKNNINKFPERYRFQLNKDELNFVMSKKSTSPKNFFSGQNGGTRKLPYAFTEQGIYMLMTVLKGDLVLITNLFEDNFFTLNEAKLANKKVPNQIICVD